jgi:hypothetical protein
VQAVRKPSVPAWAVNQLARRHPRDLAALAEAGERLARAQQDVLRGGDRSEFDRAGVDQREAVAHVTDLARELLDEAGNAASDATLERVASTLRAASTDPPARAAMLAGVLETEVAAGGFEVAGLSLAGAGSARSSRDATRRQAEASRRREELAEARQALKDARAAERELTAAAREAEDEARKAQTAAERATREAESALARAAAAAETTAEAASRVDELENATRRGSSASSRSKPTQSRRRRS